MSGATGVTFPMNTTTEKTYIGIPTVNIISTGIVLVSNAFGLVVNTLYLWVLGFRMRRSISTTWFFHLMLSNFLQTLIMPFIAVYLITDPRWVMGTFLCKSMHSLFSAVMYSSVFTLTVISLDRYCLVLHPVWYRAHMNNRYASAICISIWGLAILFCSPYFAFRQTRLLEDNKTTICYNDYTLSGSIQEKSVRWVMYIFRLIFGFLLPFAVITVCYVRIALRMKKANLARSSKPYKILFIAVISFFVSWFPYHLWYGITTAEDSVHKTAVDIMMVLTAVFNSFNYCFTPLLYLFTAENFKEALQKSVLSLIESVFN
ncbi:probable G-protein coupled receptor 33 [Xenopus laevis]|nr:probable G-protein coupled receptor 33 [Xenopus laevis]